MHPISIRLLAMLVAVGTLAACGADGDPEPAGVPPPSSVGVSGGVSFGAALP